VADQYHPLYGEYLKFLQQMRHVQTFSFAQWRDNVLWGLRRGLINA